MDELVEYFKKLSELSQKRNYYRNLSNDLDTYIRKIEKNLWYLEKMVEHFKTMNNRDEDSEGEMVDLFSELTLRGYNSISVASGEILAAYDTLKMIRDQVDEKADEYQRKINQCVLPTIGKS